MRLLITIIIQVYTGPP